jgi:hypothetical protein
MTPVPPPPPAPPEPPVPVLIVFTELLPQLGRTSSAAMSSAKMAAMEIEVSEGLMMGKNHQLAKTAHPIKREPFSPVRESLQLEWAFS